MAAVLTLLLTACGLLCVVCLTSAERRRALERSMPPAALARAQAGAMRAARGMTTHGSRGGMPGLAAASANASVLALAGAPARIAPAPDANASAASADARSALAGAKRPPVAPSNRSAPSAARAPLSRASREQCEQLALVEDGDSNRSWTLPSLSTARSRVLFAPPDRPPDRPPLRCALFVYFHFAKAGGTSVREAMARQLSASALAAAGVASTQPASWGPPLDERTGWRFAYPVYEQLRRWAASRAERARAPRLLVECHAGCTFTSMLDVVRAMRAQLEADNCTVLTLTHLREPVSQALSAWRYWALKWQAARVESLAHWVRAWLQPDHFYNEYLFGARTRALARLYATRAPADDASETDDCATWANATERALAQVDVVGTVDNWERTWLRVADVLRLPRLEPRQLKGLSACVDKRRRTPHPHLSDRCQRTAVCRDSRVTAADLAAMRDKMKCSRRAYATWAARSEAALDRYEEALVTRSPTLLSAPRQSAVVARHAPAPAAARAVTVAVPALDLFRERACHLRASYFCNWQPDETRFAASRRAVEERRARDRKERAARRQGHRAAVAARARDANRTMRTLLPSGAGYGLSLIHI